LAFWFSCFKLLVCTYKGTSSFMTSALGALVFVKVCVWKHLGLGTGWNVFFDLMTFDLANLRLTTCEKQLAESHFQMCIFRHVRPAVSVSFQHRLLQQVVPGMITGLAPTKTPAIHLWYQEGTLSWRTCVVETVDKLLHNALFRLTFDTRPTHFRHVSDSLPIISDVCPTQLTVFRLIYDQFSTRIRSFFDQLSISFRREFDQFSTNLPPDLDQYFRPVPT